MKNFRYVPFLRWKRGERTALVHLSNAGRASVTPLFYLRSDQFTEKKATLKAAAVPAPENFIDGDLSCWGASPFFLDASSLGALPAGAQAITGIAASAHAKGAHMIPSGCLSDPPAYQSAVTAIANTYSVGFCLRVDLQEMTTASTWIGSLPISLGSIDLLVDLSKSVGAVSSLGPVVDAAFAALHHGAQWRSVTIIGTSMLDNFSGYTSGLYTIPRVELALWERIRNSGLSYKLDYGDFATVPDAEPPTGIAAGFPINAKYTLPQDFLICRGVRTKGVGSLDMDVQLVGHARTIAGYMGRNSLGHCWADNAIDDIAATGSGQGNLETWVSIGVNRHIELTRHLLP